MPPWPRVLCIKGIDSPGVGRGLRLRDSRKRFNALNIASLTDIWRSLLPLPTVLNHQLPSKSRSKSPMVGLQRSVSVNSDILKYMANKDCIINKVLSCCAGSVFARFSAVSST